MPAKSKTSAQLKTRSLGNTLRRSREEQGIEIEFAAKTTKIRPELIEALEKGDYAAFASDVYIKGFLKNYSAFLGMDTEKTLALYRRETAEITHQKTVDAKPQLMEKLSLKDRTISKRGLMVTGIVIGLCLVVFYTITQIGALLHAPTLELTSPVTVTADFEGDVLVPGNSFRITGKTAAQTIVRLNSEPLVVQPDLQFETPEIPVHEGNTVLILTATNQFGRTSTIKLTIKKGGGGLVTKTKMSILVQVENADTSMLIRTDGTIQFNDVAYPGDVISLEAQSRLQIESPTPYNIKLSINGEEFKFTAQDQTWELLEGKVVQK